MFSSFTPDWSMNHLALSFLSSSVASLGQPKIVASIPAFSSFFFFFFSFWVSCAIGRLFVFALFLSCNRFLQSVLSGWRFLSRVVVNVPQCCRPLFPHWGFLVWSVASLSRGIWILLAGLGLPSSSHRSHFAARCNAASSRSGSLVCLVCLVFGFVATLLTIAAWLFWFLHVFVFFLLAAWVFLKASCQRFAYLLFSLYFCFVAVCLTCLIEFMAALRRTYRNGQRERYIYNLIIHRDGWYMVIHPIE